MAQLDKRSDSCFSAVFLDILDSFLLNYEFEDEKMVQGWEERPAEQTEAANC